MIEVVGGTYYEKCADPEWNQLFGSGGRGAAALTMLAPRVRLHTSAGKAMSHHSDLELLARTFRFELVAHKRSPPLRFTYAHPLAPPRIQSVHDFGRRSAPIEVLGETVLRFGMLECEAIVKGKRVVYDPQSSTRPSPFTENNSQADHLAIIANAAEARAMTGSSDPGTAAERLRRSERAEVAIVKLGPRGAFVRTKSRSKFIAPFETDRVWPIGSGDVFAAVFTHYWGQKGFQPDRAATLASQATAYYCAARSLPIPVLPSKWLGTATASLRLRLKARPFVYLAAPFFTTAQRWILGEARTALTSCGVRVFSPLHDVGLGPARTVAKADIVGLNRAQAVLALLDGGDEGTLFEVGYARARKIPVVCLAQNVPSMALTMFEGSDCTVVDDLATAIYKVAWSALRQ